jgi:hypothetical protein
VAAQVAAAQGAVGGITVDSSAWDESRRRQGEAEGRVRFDPGQLASALAEIPEAVVRPTAGVAYTPRDTVSRGDEAAVRQLVERIERQFDPKGVLAA